MEELIAAVEQGLLRPLDYQFGRFIYSQQKGDELVALTATLLSRAQEENHVCLELAKYAGRTLSLFPGGQVVHWPELSAWQKELLHHPCVGHSEQGGKPLILHGNKLYLARYWLYETKVAEAIAGSLAQPFSMALDTDRVKLQLERLFPEPDEGINWQKVACLLALKQRFLVITGGPGTGKTTTVIRLLALTLMQQQQAETFQVRLVAPTGKAAIRMTESIRGAKQKLQATDAIKALIPEQSSTIHRLLGAIPNSSKFRHHEHNKLHLDLLVVDEASMVDLSLMAKLVAALPDTCQLVLLGDKDQLSSVEAGSVLGDLCQGLNPSGHETLMRYGSQQKALLEQVLRQDFSAHSSHKVNTGRFDALCMLQKSYRFGGGVGLLAKAVNQGHWQQAQELLQDPNWADVEWHSAQAVDLIKQGVRAYTAFMSQLEASPEEVMNAFDSFRILCASHSGELGTKSINRAIRKGLEASGKIQEEGELYPGLPVMILRNDYGLKLFNGDIGIVLPKEKGCDELRVFFQQADGTTRSVLPARLPDFEVAYAMTIHKSQGSEFSHVAIGLPQEQMYRNLLTRELLYTGLTRAKEKVSLYASPQALNHSIRTLTERDTGLSERL